LKNITWLASYPKSGNTWLRIFLANYLAPKPDPVDINQLGMDMDISSRVILDHYLGVETSDLSPQIIDRYRPEVCMRHSASSNETHFIKTHEAYRYNDLNKAIFPPQATKNVIFLIRNPFDVTVSYAHHQQCSIDQAINYLNDSKHGLNIWTHKIHTHTAQIITNWSEHAISWINAKDIKINVFRYEDMFSTPIETFSAILRACEITVDEKLLDRALVNSAFKNLQNQENNHGFKEKPCGHQPFFRSGVTGEWKTQLSLAHQNKIIKIHSLVMEQFHYDQPSTS